MSGNTFNRGLVVSKFSFGGLPLKAHFYVKSTVLRVARVNGRYRSRYTVCGEVNRYVVPGRNIFTMIVEKNRVRAKSRIGLVPTGVCTSVGSEPTSDHYRLLAIVRKTRTNRGTLCVSNEVEITSNDA